MRSRCRIRLARVRISSGVGRSRVLVCSRSRVSRCFRRIRRVGGVMVLIMLCSRRLRMLKQRYLLCGRALNAGASILEKGRGYCSELLVIMSR